MSALQAREIVLIGAGRLATHLGLAIVEQGLKVAQVYNRNAAAGRKLADKTGAFFTDDIREITLHADLYILAVSDSALEELAAKLRLSDKTVVHTSGTMEMGILAPVSTSIGVFYPVQTFAPDRNIDFRQVPVCLEGNSQAAVDLLTVFAKGLTQHVYYLNSEQRRILHLGAVFASNFTNYIYAVSEELLAVHEIPFDLLKPLIIHTAQNVIHGNLIQSQTGPAARGDKRVLEKHRELLLNHPDYLTIYNLISSNILKHQSLHGKL